MLERTVEVEGVPTRVREFPGEGVPVVFWHGVPTDADDWLEFQKRLGRPSFAADMPGFGGTPAPDSFDCSVHTYGRWAGALLDALGIERYSLVIHDWGSIGLIPALARPDRVESMVAFNIVPFGVSYRWHYLARIWRGPAGELSMRTARGGMVGFGLTAGHPTYGPLPRSMVERVRCNFARQDTQRAILSLYRSAPTAILDELGTGISGFTPPTLLLWAQRDRYIGAKEGERLAALLPNASIERLDDAGHWSWLDRPDAIDRTVEFLA